MSEPYDHKYVGRKSSLSESAGPAMTRQGRDRLRALVEREYQTNHVAGIEWIESSLKLLRAEHRAMVRLVKQVKMRKAKSRIDNRTQLVRDDGYLWACDDILAALAKRKGGKT